jgi:hypothetical protein
MSELEYKKICREIVTGKRSPVLNNDNWGLEGVELEEIVLNRASWDDDAA